MRVAIDGRSLTDERLTGVGTYTLHIITELARLSPEDTFFVFVSGSEVARARVPDLKLPNIHFFESRLPNRLLSLILLLPFSPITLDAFLPQGVDIWFFPNHNVIKTRRPYVFTVHDLSFIHFPQFFSFKDRLARALQKIKSLSQGAQYILTPSQATARDVMETFHVQEKKVAITPLGVDHIRFTSREQPSDRTFRAAYDLNRPYILSAATLESRKNLESVIEGYDAFRAKGGEPLPLILMGATGYGAKRIRDTAKAAMFADDIRFLGFVPEKQKPALFRGASAFLFPSFYEGFGLPVLEAMSVGSPVITSFTGSIPEITSDSAILIDPFNVEDVTAALSILFNPIEGKALRQTFSKKGVARARLFSWTKTAQKTLEVLHAAVTETNFTG
jgi:glycosyltransferase involved in cell wall biosynthesis